jgi:cytoskeleton protein RodZ
MWNRKQIWMVSGVIAISLLISYFLHPYLFGPPVESPPNKQEVHEAVSIISTTQTQEVSPAVEGKPFSLELKAIEETWVQIQVNGQSQTEALFKPGEGSSYQATNRIELLIGNAGGLDMVFNGRMLERFGKSGEVVTLVFTPQGVERKKPEERKSP